MGRYNGLFEAAFHGCAILGTLRDEGRKRDVTLYAIKDEPTVIGYYDGVDTWVGSAASCGNKTILQVLAEVHAGQPREIEYGQTRMSLHDAPGMMGNPARDSMPESARPRRMASLLPPIDPSKLNPHPGAQARLMAKPIKPRIRAGGTA